MNFWGLWKLMIQKINPHPALGCNRSPPLCIFKYAILGSVLSISSEVLDYFSHHAKWVHTSKLRIQNLEFFHRILTPERHENGIEHCSRMIEEIGNSFIGANIFELPIVTGFTKGAHEVLVSVLAGFNRNRIWIHCQNTVKEDQNANHGSGEKPTSVKAWKLRGNYVKKVEYRNSSAAVVGVLVFLYGVKTMNSNTIAVETYQHGDQYLICPLCETCDYRKHKGFTKGAHEVLVSVLAGFNRNRISIHCQNTVKEDQNANHSSGEKPNSVKAWKLRGNYVEKVG